MADTLSIRIFSTGGTLDKVVYSYDDKNYVIGEPQILRILNQSNIRFKFEVDQICRKDSLDLTSEDRACLAERVRECAENKIIVTHGTDTVCETAKAMQGIAGKTIVFVGAMLPAKFVDSDATFNIGGAVIACQTLPDGMYLVSNGRVFNPLEVVKDIQANDYKVAE